MRISLMPVQLQQDELNKVVAARRLHLLCSTSQVARFIGEELAETSAREPAAVRADFVATAVQLWSAQYMHGMANVWRDVLRFSSSAGLPPYQGNYSGRFVARFMEYVDLRARSRAAQRRGARAPRPGDAMGSTAKGGVGSKLRTLSTKLFFPVDTSSMAARVATKRKKRAAVHHAPATERMIAKSLSVSLA